MNNFQTILIVIFLAFFVFAVLIFSGMIKIGSQSSKSGLQGKVVIWGTFPESDLSNTFDLILKENKELSIKYQDKDPETYQQELIESFANGVGPDLFIMTTDMIKKNSNFIYKVPYANFPEKTFRDAFINGAEIYLDSGGVLGFPIVVDPIVLFFNKDILTNEGIVYPPRSWDELFTLNPSLTKRDDFGVISQSMIALGQYENINNVKAILATLLLQNDNSIVQRGSSQINQDYVSMLNSNPLILTVSPIQAVVEFFVEFSNPSDTAYSWNRSLPNSFDMFTGGKLAFYIGRASELFKIEAANPNLSFDVTEIPQVKNVKIKRTYGEIYALAINKKSSNITSAISVAETLNQGEDAKNFGISVSLPPASKALLSDKPTDPYLFTFYNSALISRSWIDPDKEKSDLIFRELIENRLSNSLSVGEAINKAQNQLELLLKR
jgi:ABC-type glycerol-3-phosphate transport system substrate-binding protein